MSKEIDSAIEVMDRAMDDIAHLRSQLAAKDAEIARLRAGLAAIREQTLDECERRAWQIAGLNGEEMDAAYNQGWRDGAERVAHAIAALKRKGERDAK